MGSEGTRSDAAVSLAGSPITPARLGVAFREHCSRGGIGGLVARLVVDAVVLLFELGAARACAGSRWVVGVQEGQALRGSAGSWPWVGIGMALGMALGMAAPAAPPLVAFARDCPRMSVPGVARRDAAYAIGGITAPRHAGCAGCGVAAGTARFGQGSRLAR